MHSQRKCSKIVQCIYKSLKINREYTNKRRGTAPTVAKIRGIQFNVVNHLQEQKKRDTKDNLRYIGQNQVLSSCKLSCNNELCSIEQSVTIIIVNLIGGCHMIYGQVLRVGSGCFLGVGDPKGRGLVSPQGKNP